MIEYWNQTNQPKGGVTHMQDATRRNVAGTEVSQLHDTYTSMWLQALTPQDVTELIEDTTYPRDTVHTGLPSLQATGVLYTLSERSEAPKGENEVNTLTPTP